VALLETLEMLETLALILNPFEIDFKSPLMILRDGHEHS